MSESVTPPPTYAEQAARATAFMQSLHDMKGSMDSEATKYERLRESYATGSISLGQFEAKVEVLLRSATVSP